MNNNEFKYADLSEQIVIEAENNLDSDNDFYNFSQKKHSNLEKK